jgi:hypothetical protein
VERVLDMEGGEDATVDREGGEDARYGRWRGF